MTAAAAPIGLGFFPLPEAARLARLDVQTARRWAEGYTFRGRGGKITTSPGIMKPALPPIGRHKDLTFAEMLTLRLVKEFKNTGLSLPIIKRVAAVAERDFDLVNPFVSKRFRTDGRKVFLELREVAPAKDEPRLSPGDREIVEVLTGQRQFAEVVEPSFKDLDWENDFAVRWWPLSQRHAVLLDPRIVFGAPHIASTRVPTAPVAAAVRAEGSSEAAIAATAEWFGLTAGQVRDAVRFEQEWPRQAA